MTKKIKILHTEWSDGWGGQEIRIINEMLAVRKQGIEVYLACKDNAIIKQKAIENDIQVFVLPFRGNTDFKTLFALKKIIKQYDINIVNTHSGKDTWVGGFAAKLARVKFIRTRHLSNRINPSRLNFINELADYIFTTGTTVANDMVTYNRINPHKITSIPTGIDDAIFNRDSYDRQKCREFFNIKDDHVTIGIIAVLRSFKRHDRFLKMARFLIDSNPDKKLHFIVAGDGPQKENILQLIDDLGLESNITMLGHTTSVAELLVALDIFVLTSDSGEGVPQSVMQSLLMQTTTIATNAGSTKDLLDNNNFALVDKDSQSQLNNTCNNIIKQGKFTENSRKYIVDNFSKQVMTDKIYNIYYKILGLN